MFKGVMSKIVAAVLACSAFSANAGLLGSTVNVDFYYPTDSSFYCSSGTALVGAGVEYPSGCSGFSPVSIDVGDNFLTVSVIGGGSWSPGTFNGFELDVLGGIDIVSAIYGGGSMGVTGISIVDGDLWLNFAGQTGGTASFRLDDTTSVPEPASLALIALGLLGLGGMRRRITQA